MANQQPDEVDSSHFKVLPNELIIKVMASLTLGERLCFMRAFPRFKGFGLDSGLKKSVMTSYDLHLDSYELKKVLDHEQTAFELSLDHDGHVNYTKTILELTQLMCNLQEVTLKNCRFNIMRCTCGCPTYQSGFFKCSVVRELAKVKVVNFDACDSLTEFELAMACWGNFLDMHHKFSEKDSNLNTLPEVSFTNMFSTKGLVTLLLNLTKVKKVEFVNLDGECVSMDDPSLTSPEFASVYVYARLVFFLRALCESILANLEPLLEKYMGGILPSKKLVRVSFMVEKDDNSGVPKKNVSITEDFHLDSFRMHVKTIADEFMQSL